MLSEKPWRIEAVLQFCGALLCCWCLGITLAGLLHEANVAGFRQPDSFGILLLGTLGFQGAAWILILFFLRRHQTGWRDTFGFRGPQLKRALLLALAVVIIILPAAWLLQNLSGIALAKIGWPLEDQRAVKLLVDAKAWWVRDYLAVFAIVLAPVAEEFIFRGMLYPLVKRLGSPRFAFFGLSAIFAEIHLDAGTLVPLFVLALALTWLYEKTDNLLAPIAAHSLFNAVNFIVLCFVK
jgi:membrane protease YdiL (CAAX protease family)